MIPAAAGPLKVPVKLYRTVSGEFDCARPVVGPRRIPTDIAVRLMKNARNLEPDPKRYDLMGYLRESDLLVLKRSPRCKARDKACAGKTCPDAIICVGDLSTLFMAND